MTTTLNDPATINSFLLYGLFIGLPLLALLARFGALGAVVRFAMQKLSR